MHFGSRRNLLEIVGTWALRRLFRGNNGFHEIDSANPKAMTGLQTGQYADGAIIAEELLEILGSPSGGGKEGERRLVGAMVKDSQRYASTGGWGFGSYDGDSREDNPDSAAKKACFECHIPRKDQGYVFAEYRER